MSENCKTKRQHEEKERQWSEIGVTGKLLKEETDRLSLFNDGLVTEGCLRLDGGVRKLIITLTVNM